MRYTSEPYAERPTEPAVEAIHHVEIYVSNHLQSTHFFRTVLGFDALGTLTPAGDEDRISVALQRGDVCVLLTAPLTATSEVAEHISRHGERIKNIAFSVNDVDELFMRATAAEARPILRPSRWGTVRDGIRLSRVGTCGDLVHSLIGRQDAGVPLLPGLPRFGCDAARRSVSKATAEIGIALPPGELQRWVAFYVAALGFRETRDPGSELASKRSTALTTANGRVRILLRESVPGIRVASVARYRPRTRPQLFFEVTERGGALGVGNITARCGAR